MATAALPDWPPLVTRNSEACTLAPACGNSSTRMTMSCTAPPAQRIVGRFLVKIDPVFHPGPHDVIGDGDARRAGQPLRVLAHQHRRHLVSTKPAGVLEFLAIYRDLLRH